MSKRPEQRRLEIASIAAEMIHRRPLSELTMAMVAAKVGIAKGTLYLYYGSKEELLLTVLLDRIEDWFADVESRLGSLRGRGTPDDIAMVFADSLGDRDLLLELLGALHDRLEHNIEVEPALAFRQRLHTWLSRVGLALEAAFAPLEPGQGQRMMLYIHALIVGMRHATMPAPVVAKILTLPGMDGYELQFEHDFPRALASLLRGCNKTCTST